MIYYDSERLRQEQNPNHVTFSTMGVTNFATFLSEAHRIPEQIFGEISSGGSTS